MTDQPSNSDGENRKDGLWLARLILLVALWALVVSGALSALSRAFNGLYQWVADAWPWLGPWIVVLLFGGPIVWVYVRDRAKWQGWLVAGFILTLILAPFLGWVWVNLVWPVEDRQTQAAPLEGLPGSQKVQVSAPRRLLMTLGSEPDTALVVSRWTTDPARPLTDTLLLALALPDGIMIPSETGAALTAMVEFTPTSGLTQSVALPIRHSGRAADTWSCRLGFLVPWHGACFEAQAIQFEAAVLPGPTTLPATPSPTGTPPLTAVSPQFSRVDSSLEISLERPFRATLRSIGNSNLNPQSTLLLAAPALAALAAWLSRQFSRYQEALKEAREKIKQIRAGLAAGTDEAIKNASDEWKEVEKRWLPAAPGDRPGRVYRGLRLLIRNLSRWVYRHLEEPDLTSDDLDEDWKRLRDLMQAVDEIRSQADDAVSAGATVQEAIRSALERLTESPWKAEATGILCWAESALRGEEPRRFLKDFLTRRLNEKPTEVEAEKIRAAHERLSAISDWALQWPWHWDEVTTPAGPAQRSDVWNSIKPLLPSNPFGDLPAESDSVLVDDNENGFWEKHPVYAAVRSRVSSVVFGVSGSGKTAMRRVLVRSLPPPAEKVLVVAYPGRWSGRDWPATSEDHCCQLGERLARAALHYVLANPPVWRQMSAADRQCVCAYVKNYGPDWGFGVALARQQFSENVTEEKGQRERFRREAPGLLRQVEAAIRGADLFAGNGFSAWWLHTQTLLNALDRRAAYVIVDDLAPAQFPGVPVEELLATLIPLARRTRAVRVQVIFKFFVDLDLREPLEKSRSLNGLDCQVLDWSQDQLDELLKARFRAVKANDNLDRLCERNFHWQELTRAARTPDDLMRYGEALVRWHARKYGQSTSAEYQRFTPEGWEAVKTEFAIQ
mgnify:CR=1 FL=1